jgi:hypothetical protein
MNPATKQEDPLLAAAAIKTAATTREATLNTPEFYTASIACASCLTIFVLMAVGAW